MRAFRVVLHALGKMFRQEPWWAEFWSATVAILWAVLSHVASPDLSVWPSMRLLTQLGDEKTWNLIAFGTGLTQLVFLLFDHRWLRWGAAILACWFWCVLTLGVWIATPWAPAIALYAGQCGVNLFSILRLLKRHG